MLRTMSAAKDRLLTVRWNNVLTVVLGLPAFAFAGVALLTAHLTDAAAFWGFFGIGALY
jgi:hypothetical protein